VLSLALSQRPRTEKHGIENTIMTLKVTKELIRSLPLHSRTLFYSFFPQALRKERKESKESKEQKDYRETKDRETQDREYHKESKNTSRGRRDDSKRYPKTSDDRVIDAGLLSRLVLILV
jgi:hypothetical protein